MPKLPLWYAFLRLRSEHRLGFLLGSLNNDHAASADFRGVYLKRSGPLSMLKLSGPLDWLNARLSRIHTKVGVLNSLVLNRLRGSPAR